MEGTIGSVVTGLVVILVTFIASIVGYFYYSYQYWKKKGVPCIEPTFPRGNLDYIISSKTTFGVESKDWYDEFKRRGLKFGGIWTYARPVLVLVDPEYIKDILVKDFNHFIDRDMYCNEKDDPQAAHLFVVKSNSWKNMRQKLTPTFTSGKMKMMFNTVSELSSHMIEAMEKHAQRNEDIPIREMLQSFTIDVIGSCAFGIECNSFKNPDAEFKKMAVRLFTPTFFEQIKFTFLTYFPNLSKKLGLRLSRKDIQKFFADVVERTVEYREQNGVNRPDFLQLLIDLKNSTKTQEKPFKFDQMVANVVLFFIAGFDTSATTMNFVLYGLAQNPEIQEKARREINEVLSKYDGKITYESLKEMKYLVQVIYESQRLFPPLPSLARVCVKDYHLRDTDILIEKGTPVVISTYGLGRDPEYFPDPEKFDPERFNEENNGKIPSCVHLPFGEGPRNCIGLRFGMMQSQIGLISILRRFRLSVSPSTKLPLTLNKYVFLIKTNETLYLKAETI